MYLKYPYNKRSEHRCSRYDASGEKDNKIELLDAGHKIFFSSNGTTRSNGLGFLVNKRFASLIEDYRLLSDRLAVLSLNSMFSKITLIQCYIPTSKYPDDAITDMYI